MKLGPVLFQELAVLLDYCSLLGVDDRGGRHDDGSTFTWGGLVGENGQRKLRTNRNPPWTGQGSLRAVSYALINWNISHKHTGIWFNLAGIS